MSFPMNLLHKCQNSVSSVTAYGVATALWAAARAIRALASLTVEGAYDTSSTFLPEIASNQVQAAVYLP